MFHNIRFSLFSRRLLVLPVICFFIMFGWSSCKAKYGCPSNGKNVGAERLLGGEKVPKAKKFRA
jgi:hypothetical protein